ncbi:MAG: hypothetical protein J6S12_01255 [Alphaproteobacteria bacterium]|nr:hypothetical protein [Alphaproteobacteria bacterium]
MIDYDKTLEKFFKQCIVYLEKRAKTAKDKYIQKDIFDAIWTVQTISDNPRQYADYNVRVKTGLESHAVVDGFMAGTRDNSAYLVYSKVLNSMADLDSQFSWKREKAQETLLKAKSAMEYKNSTNFLKDFIWPFKSLKTFGVKVKQK